MILKTYHLNGIVKYEGVSFHTKRNSVFYDIGDSTLCFFNEKYLIKEYNSDGVLIKRFYYKTNKINPTGKLEFPSEFSFYEGEVLQGKANGRGKLYYLSEDNESVKKLIYDGDFLDNKRHGKGITYDLQGNVTFHGTFRNDFPNGYGESFYQNYTYKGNWRNGKYNGDCEIWNNTRCVYRGLWENFEGETVFFAFMTDHPHEIDSGEINIDSGSLYYSGGFMNGRRHGIGKEFDGFCHLVYDGAWKQGKRHGYGDEYTFCPFHGEMKQYSGNFQYHRRSGFGIEWNTDCVFLTDLHPSPRYEGQWLDGKRHGRGTIFYYNNVKEFSGNFRNGEFVQGNVYYHPLSTHPNKVLYNGQVSKYSFDGLGTMFSPQQKICFSGNWKQGYPFQKNVSIKNVSIFTIFSKKSPEYQGDFQNGKFHGKGSLYYEDKVIHSGDFRYGYIFDGKTCYYDKRYKLCFRGVMKNERFWTGITSEHEIWRQGVKIKNISVENIRVQKYLETRDNKLLRKISKQALSSYLWKKFEKKCKKSKKIIVQKLEREHSKIQEKASAAPEPKYDLFGIEITNAVIGTDGNTYDLKSLEYLFERDKFTNDFIRISYCYNVNNERYPCYPMMGNGKRLEGYRTSRYKCFELPKERFILYHNEYQDNS